MIDEINAAIGDYQIKWCALIKGRKDVSFFESLKPFSVGWKVADLAEFDRRFAELRGRCVQVHLMWMNDRWIATMFLKEGENLSWNIPIIKLMQRRPKSTDALGLDNVDFYTPDFLDANTLCAKESDLKFTDEFNGECKWTSLWFDGTEAKIRNQTSADVTIAELQLAQERLSAFLSQ